MNEFHISKAPIKTKKTSINMNNYFFNATEQNDESIDSYKNFENNISYIYNNICEYDNNNNNIKYTQNFWNNYKNNNNSNKNNIKNIYNNNNDNIINEINFVKMDINKKYFDLKSDIMDIKNEIKELKKLIIQSCQKNYSSCNCENLIYKKNNDLINNNKYIFNFNENLLKNKKYEYSDNIFQSNNSEINNNRKVTISKDNKDILININEFISFKEFQNIIKMNFLLNLNDIIEIFYYNSFGTKIIIKNESIFKKTIEQKICKYYIIKKELKKNLSYDNIKKKKQLIPKDIKSKEDNDYSLKENAKEILKHFSSLASTSANIKKDDYINSTVIVSDLIKQINIKEQKKYPNKFIKTKEILKMPGLLSKANNKKNEDEKFILSLISNILEEKGINCCIPIESSGNLDSGASLQYLFAGLTEKKKYKIKLNLNKNDNDIFIKKEDELNNLIDNFKNKFSYALNTNKNDILLINPKYENGQSSFDLFSEDNNIYKNINNLKLLNEVTDIKESPLIEGCQLNSGIFDPKLNNKDGGWAIGEQRGGLDYISPLGWVGYGLNILGKYDNGDNTWLGMSNNPGVYAVAYFGISNVYGNKNHLKILMEEIASQNVLNMGYEQIYKNDKDLNNPSKKCGCGVYLFQDPKIAENTAGIINVGGVEYKLLLMCRVKPDKIRKPEGFKDCWILNSTPFEIRPYRILVKKIFKSALAGASQDEIITFTSKPPQCKNIVKDTSFYYTKKTIFSNYIHFSDEDFVISLYTSHYFIEINSYLREGKLMEKGELTENQIKSWIWCLNSALRNKKSNIKNGTYLYRGVSKKFPDNLGVGYKFIFPEFISSSIDLNIAKNFGCGGTLFKIRIEKNLSPNFYCYYVDDISQVKGEKEVLITFGCSFQITKKKSEPDGTTKVYITCYGPGLY